MLLGNCKLIESLGITVLFLDSEVRHNFVIFHKIMLMHLMLGVVILTLFVLQNSILHF